MDIGLVRLLKRGMPSSRLKKLWCPTLLCQGCKHRVAKNVGRDCNARARSNAPKERVYICIRQCLAGSRALAFEEQMIGFHRSCVRNSNVGHDFVDEVG